MEKRIDEKGDALMIHLLTEENSDLKNRVFPITKGIRTHLMNTLQNYQGDKTSEGYKRLNNLLQMDGIHYSEMKRIKNFFDNYQGNTNNPEYILNGGDAMNMWVNSTLNTARKAIKDFKQGKKDAGFQNAFRKTHTKQRNNTTPQTEGRTFVVTSTQVRLLKEAINDKFSLEELSNIPSYVDRVRYCVEHLGKPIGKGSGRAVFQYDDDKCLKLAYNTKGITQNAEEIRLGAGVVYYDIFPEVIEYDPRDKWIVAEYVLPAKKTDFPKVFGITWKEFCDFVDRAHEQVVGRSVYSSMTDERYEELLDNEDLRDVDEYIRGENPPIGDLQRINSWGLTTRNDLPSIVLLDFGLNRFNPLY